MPGKQSAQLASRSSSCLRQQKVVVISRASTEVSVHCVLCNCARNVVANVPEKFGPVMICVPVT